MVASLQEGQHHGAHGAHAGSGGYGVFAAFHSCAFQLKGPGSGVAAAGIDGMIAGDLLGKLGSAFFHGIKAESGGLVNGSSQRTVSTVRTLARMDDHSLEINSVQIDLAHFNCLLKI